MKQILLFSAALLVTTAAFAQLNKPSIAQLNAAPQHTRTLAKKAPKRAGGSETAKYLPAKETEYEYADGAWTASSTYAYTYDANGNIARQDETYDGTINRTDNEWTSYGYNTLQVTSSSEDGTTFVNSMKRVQAFDDVVHSLCIQKDKYEWGDNGWTAITDAYKRKVTRDADGNVTSVVVSVPYDGAYEDTRRITNTVSPDTKQITSSKFEQLGYNSDYTGFEWTTEYELTDIVWAKTNGQVVDEFSDWLDNEDNQVASAKLNILADEERLTGQFTVTRDGKGGYVAKLLYEDNSVLETVTKTMGENGSYTIVNCYQMDENGDGVLDEEDDPEYEKTVVEYDAYGNLTLEEGYYSEDGETWEMLEGNKQVYTYDTEHPGAVRETIYYVFDYEDEAYVPSIKIVVDELTAVANGIKTVSSEDASTARIYNLQGIEQNADFTALPAGVYIVKTARQTVKVIKR